jgi:phage terminase large subunit-like protein
MLGHRLEDFQREIVEEVFAPRRETLVLIPRANGKSTLLAAIALWELLKSPRAQIVVGAASREQASVLSTSRARWPSTRRFPRAWR